MTAILKGLKRLRKQLDAICEPNVKKREKFLRAAARKAFAPVVEKAKSLVPVDSGALRESLRLSFEKGAKGTDAVVIVGLRVAGGTSGQKQAAMAAAAFGESQSKQLPPARRWHFIELGTARIPAKSFARRALDEDASAVLATLGQELNVMIRRATKQS